MANKRQARARRNNTRWLIVVAGAAILVVAALILINVISMSPTSAAGNDALGQCGKPECGQANAPVTIEIYGDFQ